VDQKRATIAGLIFAGIGLVIVAVAYMGHRASTAPGRTATDKQTTAQADGQDQTASSTPSQQKRVTAATKGSPTTAHSSKSKAATTKEAEDPEKADPHFDYGQLPSVRPDANPQTRSVAEALRDKDKPERLSPLIQPKPFDPKAYQANPKAYLNVVEPGRVFQTAQPAKDVPRIRPLSPQLQNVKQGESVKLRVQAKPNYPVSFCSFDGGTFKETGLNSITVQANEVGVAEVTFVGSPGTINECNVLAGSPMASGQVKYMVNVTKP